MAATRFHKTHAVSRFNRRSCLKDAAVALVGASTISVLRADAQEGSKSDASKSSLSKSQVRLGFGNYGMKGLAAEDAVKCCSEIGYEGLELCLIDDWPTSLARLSTNGQKRLVSTLADAGLLVPSLLESLPCLRGLPAHRANLERLKSASGFAKRLQQSSPPVIQSIVGGKSADWDTSKYQLVDELGDWADVGAKAGVTVCFKPHASHLVTRPEQAQWVIEQVGSAALKVVYDYSHFYLDGLGLRESLEDLLPVVAYIQVKDSQRLPDGKYRYLLPGDGETDYDLLFQAIVENRYHGFVNVEVSSMIHRQEGYDPIATARRCYDRMRPALSRALKSG